MLKKMKFYNKKNEDALEEIFKYMTKFTTGISIIKDKKLIALKSL